MKITTIRQLSLPLPLSLFMTVALVPATRASAAPAKGYSATQAGNVLQVTSPHGSRIYLGDVGFDDLDSYRFEVPLSELTPPAPPAVPPQSRQGGSESQDPSPANLGDVNSILLEANRLYNKGKFDSALRFVDEAVRREADNPRAWVMRGSLFHALGQKDMARQAWEKAQTLDPENKQIQNILRSYQ